MGIAALLGAGDFGETSIRILLTTVIVGCASVLTLCCLVVVGSRFEAVGLVGGLVVLCGVALGLLMVWSDSEDLIDSTLEPWGVVSVVAVTLAQICLLLGVAGDRRSLTWLLAPTIGLGAVLAGQISALVLEYDPDDGFMRLLGIVAILDVLGTLITIAVGVFGGDAQTVKVTMPAPLAAQLRTRSAETGRPVHDLVDEAVTRYLGSSID
jgi:hypothetical protein